MSTRLDGIMPFVLDYDSVGNVVGGHVVEELPHNPPRGSPYHGPLLNPLYEPPRPHRSLPKPLQAPPYRHYSLPKPLFQDVHRQPVFTPIHQAPERISSPPPVSTKGAAFLESFIKRFESDASTMVTFEALFRNYNEGSIDEADFYTGIFMLLSQTESWHLLPGLVAVLPASWQAKDLTWLHHAAEARYEDKIMSKSISSDMSRNVSTDVAESVSSDAVELSLSDAVTSNSPNAIECPAPDDALEHTSLSPEDMPPPAKRAKRPPRAPPAKRIKRAPRNGFRSSHACTNADVQPMFVNPAALMIHQPVIAAMPDSDTGSDPATIDEQPSRKGLVRLKLKKNTSHKPDLEALPSRKGRGVRYGDMFAAEITHFGQFPTRRAVIARDSKPYVHLSCGKGFCHPMDLRAHHRERERTTRAGGCSGQGDDDKWDAHPSARVEYPMINYTKVKDGYVLLDKESRDLIDNAVAAGLEYLADQENTGSGSLTDEDLDEEIEMETD